MGLLRGLSGKESAAKQELQETRVRSQGQEDPLEKESAPYSSILAWRIPWVEEPGGLQSMGSQRVGHNFAPKQQQNVNAFALCNLSLSLIPRWG